MVACRSRNFDLEIQGKMRGLNFLLLLTIAFIFSGCAAKTGEKPPVIRYGEDICAECRMIVSEPKFTAALYDGREWKKFDDIGCMDIYRQKQSVSGTAWVHDHTTEQWLPNERAVRVFSKNLRTPMGYGKAAFSSQEAAKNFEQSINGKSDFNMGEKAYEYNTLE